MCAVRSPSAVGDNAEGLAGVETDVSSYRVRIAAEAEAVPIGIVGQVPTT